MALGGFIMISSGVGTETSSGSVSVSTSNAGSSGVSGDLSLNTGTASAGTSGDEPDEDDFGCPRRSIPRSIGRYRAPLIAGMPKTLQAVYRDADRIMHESDRLIP